MLHVLYSDGNAKKISWVIKTEEVIIEQSRDHAEMYLNKVTDIQSKYIALHVGLFWGIGTFVIKNNDSVIVKLDNKEMVQHLTTEKTNSDEFIQKKLFFIKQLISQRKLKIEYELIQKEKN